MKASSNFLISEADARVCCNMYSQSNFGMEVQELMFKNLNDDSSLLKYVTFFNKKQLLAILISIWW